MAESELAGTVLDASALLAHLVHEPGNSAAEAVLAAGAASSRPAIISVVNYAEVLSRISGEGGDPIAADQRLRDGGLIGGLIQIVPFTEEDAITAA